MRHTEYTASVKQDHNGFFDDGHGHEAFQRIKSTKPRLSEKMGAVSGFQGKTDFDLHRERRRKDNKPTRHARIEIWEDANA